jgi:putative NADH-flavin reductase
MKRVSVLGAGGQIARWVIDMLANRDDVKLTLFLRHAKKLGKPPKNSRVVQGDVLQKEQLSRVIVGQDIVYANLTGEDIDRRQKQSWRRWMQPR